MIHLKKSEHNACCSVAETSEVEVKVTMFPPRLLSCHVSPELGEDLEASSPFPDWRLISVWITGKEGAALMRVNEK